MFRSCLRRQTVLPFILSLALLAGCSDDDRTTAPDPTGSDNLNLEDEFGGYAATDELPSFNDEIVSDITNEERDVDDNVAGDPETTRIESDENTRVYAVTLRWGHFGGLNDLGASETSDWSGSLRVNGDSRIVLLNVMSFEQNDGAILPRQDPQILEWESTVTNGHDGIRVVVLQPVDDVAGPADSLFLTTSLFTAGFSLDELSDYDNLMDVDDAGLQLRLQSIEADSANDVQTFQGWVDGRWNWSPENNRGEFRGVWVNPRAGAIGHVRGHFGTNKAGENVFFGKYINRAGEFQGFLRGSFSVGDGDVEHGRGAFQGNWFSADRDSRGRIIGRWATRGDAHGFFSGKWCQGRCL